MRKLELVHAPVQAAPVGNVVRKTKKTANELLSNIHQTLACVGAVLAPSY
jgi:hypothetical protein